MYFNGALSLQPEGLRPITSLSTLDRHGCPYRPKTRYQVRWVTASWAALTAASKHSASWRTTCQYRQTELLSNVVYSKLTLGGFPAVDCAFINTVDELHAGNHISELPEST